MHSFQIISTVCDWYRKEINCLGMSHFEKWSAANTFPQCRHRIKNVRGYSCFELFCRKIIFCPKANKDVFTAKRRRKYWLELVKFLNWFLQNDFSALELSSVEQQFSIVLYNWFLESKTMVLFFLFVLLPKRQKTGDQEKFVLRYWVCKDVYTLRNYDPKEHNVLRSSVFLLLIVQKLEMPFIFLRDHKAAR